MAKLVEGTNNPEYETHHAYPRMMYRKGAPASAPDGSIANCFHGLHCETTIVTSAEDQAEHAQAGWATSPALAHGKADADAVPDAKDAEIALLKAQLAESEARRKPGRPPREAAPEATEQA